MKVLNEVKEFLITPKMNIIDGELRPALSRKVYPSRNASDGSVLTETASSGSEDVDAAARAAHKVFPAWSKSAPGYREAVLRKFALLIQEHHDELAQLESLETGKPHRSYNESRCDCIRL